MKTDVLGRVIINAPFHHEQQGKKIPKKENSAPSPQNHVVYICQRKTKLHLWCKLKSFFIYIVVLKRSVYIS